MLYILYSIRGRDFYLCMSIVLSGVLKINLNKFEARVCSHPLICNIIKYKSIYITYLISIIANKMH